MAQALHHPSRRATALLAAAIAVVVMLFAAGVAHANWYYTKSGAERVARDYVSKHYANTYYENLTAYCRPQGRRYNSRYKYHRWVCGWYDRSDNTSGAVLIVGSDTSPGAYYGRVLRGARFAS